MIARPRRKCEVDGCKGFAHWGTRGAVPERCELHRLSSDADRVLQRCNTCFLPKVVDHTQLCADCGSQFLSYRLCKQRRVKAYIDGAPDLKHYTYYDEIVDEGKCGKKRPDFAWDCGTHWVVLEVDEDAHRDRVQCLSEETRMVDVTLSFGMSTIFIRYNPDRFRGQRDSLREKDRLQVVHHTLLAAFRATPADASEMLRVRYLYYDDHRVGEWPLHVQTISCVV